MKDKGTKTCHSSKEVIDYLHSSMEKLLTPKEIKKVITEYGSTRNISYDPKYFTHNMPEFITLLEAQLAKEVCPYLSEEYCPECDRMIWIQTQSTNTSRRITMAEKLKTLEDIIGERFTHRLIKAEAIKWVKFWTEQWRKEGNYGDDNYDPCSLCFKHFFNITSEDLK